MRRSWKYLTACLLLSGSLAFAGCGSSGTTDNSGGGGNDTGNNDGGNNNGGGTTPPTAPAPQVVFTPVGDAIAFDVIDLEFLPGMAGEAIAVGKDGSVYYLNGGFHLVGSPETIVTVQDGTERGLLNVAADPSYAMNHFVYFYYTVTGSSPDVNRIERYTVVADSGANTFALQDPHTIIEFDKIQSTSPGTNHNGGSMLFDFHGNLILGVGDGGDGASIDKIEKIGQNPDVRLGKIHRIIPDRTPGAGTGEDFTVPSGQNVSTNEPSIYALGVRNPFTIVMDEDEDYFFGDVGSDNAGASASGPFEEINCLYQAGENYGWPLFEGPDAMPPFTNPLHGYKHGDETFSDQDPEPNPSGPESIMVSAYYLGDQYGGVFTKKLIYNEFFAGWVRLLSLDLFDHVTKDENIGHLEGLIGLHENPADGLLYGQSLFGSDHIQRMDLVP